MWWWLKWRLSLSSTYPSPLHAHPCTSLWSLLTRSEYLLTKAVVCMLIIKCVVKTFSVVYNCIHKIAKYSMLATINGLSSKLLHFVSLPVLSHTTLTYVHALVAKHCNIYYWCTGTLILYVIGSIYILVHVVKIDSITCFRCTSCTSTRWTFSLRCLRLCWTTRAWRGSVTTPRGSVSSPRTYSR